MTEDALQREIAEAEGLGGSPPFEANPLFANHPLTVTFVEQQMGSGRELEYVRGDAFDAVVAALDDRASGEIKERADRAIREVETNRERSREDEHSRGDAGSDGGIGGGGAGGVVAL